MGGELGQRVEEEQPVPLVEFLGHPPTLELVPGNDPGPSGGLSRWILGLPKVDLGQTFPPP